MRIHSKKIIGIILVLLYSLSFMAGCGEKDTQVNTNINNIVISDAMLKSITNRGVVSITDDSPASIWWVPKAQKTTLNEVIAWLQQAKPYIGEIPYDQISGTFNANMAPSKLYIINLDKHEIILQPAFYLASIDGKSYQASYVTNVLKLSYDNQVSYIQSTKLFNWLKNDEWKAEFKITI